MMGASIFFGCCIIGLAIHDALICSAHIIARAIKREEK